MYNLKLIKKSSHLIYLFRKMLKTKCLHKTINKAILCTEDQNLSMVVLCGPQERLVAMVFSLPIAIFFVAEDPHCSSLSLPVLSLCANVSSLSITHFRFELDLYILVN